MAKVLLIDDELTMVQMVTELLRQEGHEVFPFSNYNAAVAALEAQRPELVITDLYLDKTRTHGLEILQKARALNPPATVIVITAYGTIETAVEAMKKGAFDYLEKPFKVDDLRLCIQRALSYNDAISENVYLRKQLKKKYQFNQLIGNAPKMQDVFKMIERVADTDSTILILGESGTGKELVARALHFNSRRQFAPFIPINCSALPENLLESELFGHCKGAFTGAINDKKGLFQEADGGTIFLDEIGSMPPLLQSRLLRVLQEREVRRVGTTSPINVNVRVLAATNEPLEKRIKDGTFREDLYYRLNVIPDQSAQFARAPRGHSAAGRPFPAQQDQPAHRPAVSNHAQGPGGALARTIGRATCANWKTPSNAPCALCEGQHHPGCAICPRGSCASSQRLSAGAGGRIGRGRRPRRKRRRPPCTRSSAAEPARPSRPGLGQRTLRPAERLSARAGTGPPQPRPGTAGGDKEKAALLLGVSLATLYRKLADDEREA